LNIGEQIIKNIERLVNAFYQDGYADRKEALESLKKPRSVLEARQTAGLVKRNFSLESNDILINIVPSWLYQENKEIQSYGVSELINLHENAGEKIQKEIEKNLDSYVSNNNQISLVIKIQVFKLAYRGLSLGGKLYFTDFIPKLNFKAFIPELIYNLCEEDERILIKTLDKIRFFKERRPRVYVLKLIKKSPRIRIAVLGTLSVIGSKKDLISLYRYAFSSNQREREEVYKCFRNILGKNSVWFLERFYRRCSNEKEGEVLLSQLGSIKNRASLLFLIKIYKEGKKNGQLKSIIGMHQYKHKEKLILKRCRKAAKNNHFQLFSLLGEFRSKVVFDYLKYSLKEVNEESVKVEILEQFAYFDGDSLIDVIESFCEQCPDYWYWGLSTILRSNYQKKIEWLDRYLSRYHDRENDGNCLLILQFLKYSRFNQSSTNQLTQLREFLKLMLSSDDKNIRLSAVEALPGFVDKELLTICILDLNKELTVKEEKVYYVAFAKSVSVNVFFLDLLPNRVLGETVFLNNLDTVVLNKHAASVILYALDDRESIPKWGPFIDLFWSFMEVKFLDLVVKGEEQGVDYTPKFLDLIIQCSVIINFRTANYLKSYYYSTDIVLLKEKIVFILMSKTDQVDVHELIEKIVQDFQEHRFFQKRLQELIREVS
jgi:hypothetical protein